VLAAAPARHTRAPALHAHPHDHPRAHQPCTLTPQHSYARYLLTHVLLLCTPGAAARGRRQVGLRRDAAQVRRRRLYRGPACNLSGRRSAARQRTGGETHWRRRDHCGVRSESLAMPLLTCRWAQLVCGGDWVEQAVSVPAVLICIGWLLRREQCALTGVRVRCALARAHLPCALASAPTSGARLCKCAHCAPLTHACVCRSAPGWTHSV
jgi:hypothetical protein